MVGVACYIVGWADAADSRADGQVIELKGRVTALEAAAASAAILRTERDCLRTESVAVQVASLLSSSVLLSSLELSDTQVYEP